MTVVESVSQVSVVIPAYNGEAHLQEALHSIFGQTKQPEEVIVVDDCSTDGTSRLIEEIAKRAPVPIQLIRLAENSGGPTRPMNVGIAAARSPMIAVLDQDDVFLPNKIERQSEILTSAAEIAVVFGYFGVRRQPSEHADEACGERQQRRLRKEMAACEDYSRCYGAIALRVLLNHGNRVGGFPGFMFRRSDWQAIGGIDERLAASADYDLLCRLCERGDVAMVPEQQYEFRLHGDNFSSSRIRCHTDEIETLAKFANSSAWNSAGVEVRRAIGAKCSRLALWFGVSGHREAAQQLLKISLFLNGQRISSLFRTIDMALKVRRRRRRSPGSEISAEEWSRTANSVRTIMKLYPHRASFPEHVTPLAGGCSSST